MFYFSIERKLNAEVKEDVEGNGHLGDSGRSTVSSTVRGTQLLELPDFTPAVKQSLRDNESETVWTVVSLYT